ncbi:MAG: NAD-binding protein [Nanoarchaeota archaeon]|nr:NAD-binding protein [Nanoarchaeota archaeon]MBU4299928.1 NAD-binding protein [Nanoarchaeota archaeon]MBU4451376.1 NAD-binding protein [Nanoarchaeota archaeon]MCG2724583.1 NAD-binding protein [archaeon]
MHIIIAGGGKIGVSLAETLSAHKHDVILIEEDKRKCQEIADEFNGVVLNGDATDEDVLKEAKIGRADVFAAVTSSQEANLLACLLAKEMSKAKTLARLSGPGYEKLFKKAGVDIVLSPEDAFASRLESMIVEPDVVDIAMIHRGNIEMLEFTVTLTSRALGKKVLDLEKPRGSLIVAIKEGKEFVIPDVHTMLRLGDRVIVLVKKHLEKDVRKMFQ